MSTHLLRTGTVFYTMKDDDMSVSTVAPSSYPEHTQVDLVEGGIVGGLGTRLEERLNSPAELDADDEALRDQAREVAAIQDKETGIAHLKIDLTAEYKRPNISEAKAFRVRYHPSDGQGKPLSWLKTNTGSYFSKTTSGILQYGAGISNYFKWLKWMGWVYFLLSLIQLPCILINVFGGSYFDDSGVIFLKTTLGNLFVEPLFINETDFVDVELAFQIPFSSCTNNTCNYKRSNVLLFYSLSDVFATVVLLLMISIGTQSAVLEARRFKRLVLKVEHYSLMIEGVPSSCTNEELQEHFENLLNCRIHDVQLVQSTGNAISLCVQRGRLIKRLARLDSYRKYVDSSNGSLAKREKAARKYDVLVEKIAELDRETSERAEKGTVLFAFISFEKQRDRKRCLEMYNAFTCSWGQAKHLRYNHEHTLCVSIAPAPSTLLWENNEVSTVSRVARRWVTITFMFLLLLLTATITYVSDPYKLSKSFYDSIGDTSTTSTICGGVFANITSLQEALTIAALNEETLDCLCKNQLDPFSDKFENSTLTNGEPLYGDNQPCSGALEGYTDNLEISVGVSFATLLVNVIVFFALTEATFFMKFTSVLQRELTTLRRLFIVTYINTAIMLLVVNADIEALFGFRFPSNLEKLFGNGLFVDFSSSWYGSVGFEVVVLGVLNIFAPHMYPLLIYLIKLFYLKVHKPISQAELHEMYLGPEFVLSYRYAQVLMGSYFVLTYSTGIPILYPIAFFGIVISYWIDKLFFTTVCRTPIQFSNLLSFWTYNMLQWGAILHLAMGIWMLSSPSLFPEDATSNSLAFIEDVGNAAGFNSTFIESVDLSGLSWNGFQVAERIFNPRCIPALLVIILFCIIKVLTKFQLFLHISNKLVKQTWRVLKFLLRSTAFGLMDDYKNDGSLTLQQAIDVGMLSGISSYNILANPTYSRAFQLETDSKASGLLDVLRKKAADGASFTFASSSNSSQKS